MTKHHKAEGPSLRSLSKRQWIKIISGVAGVALVTTGAVATSSIYHHETEVVATATPTAYSVTDTDQPASRGNAREALGEDTMYINVSVNGTTRPVFGENFTDVKSVLEAGDITLESNDTVSPSLDTPVDESTVITIERAGATMETTEKKLPYNTVKKETADLPKGTEKVQTEGEEGILEQTNLVTRAGDKVVSSNTFATYVKKAPVEKVILVGTGSTESEKTESTSESSSSSSSSKNDSSSSSSIGTTVPVGDMQQWAHDYLLSNGGTEADFTATVYIISHESGWSVTATNPSSGAYGLAQALPGSKMSSHGSDWATNYQTQLRWFWDYCKSRYGSIQGAYNFWVANHWY